MVKTLLLNLNFYFTLKLIDYTYYIIMYKLNKNNINYRHILIYIKKIIKKLIFNLKNKINSTKSNNKTSKTYYKTSNIVRKGLTWFGLRQLNIKYYNIVYNKLLILNIFNFKSNISICGLELFKFLYYSTFLNKKYTKFVINTYYFNNYILYNNNTILSKINNNNINLIY